MPYRHRVNLSTEPIPAQWFALCASRIKLETGCLSRALAIRQSSSGAVSMPIAPLQLMITVASATVRQRCTGQGSGLPPDCCDMLLTLWGYDRRVASRGLRCLKQAEQAIVKQHAVVTR